MRQAGMRIHRGGRRQTSRWNLSAAVIAAAAGATLCAAAAVVTACSPVSVSRGQAAYRPFYSMPRSAAPQPRGTLKGDFDWAASAPTLEEAAARWTEFLREHEPSGGEFEDAFQQNHVRAAQFELMRVEYLRARVEQGDRLLTRLEDVKRNLR